MITAVTVPIILTFGIVTAHALGRKITARGFSFEDGRVDRRDEGRPARAGSSRPARSRIDRRVDVVSRGESIDAGTEFVVVEVSSNG